ncbi:MAG: AMP-binding protein [Bacteroidales bacterium]|nr:AMP-binding protein [Candidatus Cacconaster merdequi]
MERNNISREFKPFNELFSESLKSNWERPALSNLGGDTIHYKDLAARIAQLHIFFASCGLKRGDKVAICAKNQANWGVAFLATLTYGAVAVPILHEFKPANIRHLISHSEASILFVGDVIWEKMTEVDTGSVTVVSLVDFSVLQGNNSAASETAGNMAALFAERYPDGFGKNDVNYKPDEPEDLALINYTSGTSGFSKGVMIPYRALVSNIFFAKEVEPQMDNRSKVVAMLPSAHMYGMMFEFLFEIMIGAEVFFLRRLPSPKVLLSAMAEVKPSVIIAVPMIIEKIYKQILIPFISRGYMRLLLNLPVIDQVVQQNIQQKLIHSFGGNFNEVIIGGAPFNKEAESFLKRIKFPMTIGYGMTECAPIITYVPHDKTRLYSCGKPVAGMEVKIDSADPFNIPGEILVKGVNVCLGYYKNEAATEAAFRDGWFCTGDMGVIDADGYLYIKGRCKSMILGPSGQNIYPEEIENILNNMPYVVESLVIEDNDKLVALIFPDFEQVEEAGLDQRQLLEKLNENMKAANLELPQYCKISSVEVFPEEFEKTPKRSIKRYLYQRNTN